MQGQFDPQDFVNSYIDIYEGKVRTVLDSDAHGRVEAAMLVASPFVTAYTIRYIFPESVLLPILGGLAAPIAVLLVIEPF